MSVSDDGIRGAREFPATSWSVILHARDPDSAEHQRHVRRLVELYWKPVYCVLRYAWGKGHDDAKDLTQEFFATVVFDRALLESYSPSRGSFRALLRTALARFMTDMNRGATRQKRGGNTPVLSLDDLGPDDIRAAPDTDRFTPEELFDLAFRQTVMTASLDRCRQRLIEAGKESTFEMFRRYELDDEPVSYAALGAQYGVTVPQVKHALRDARATFRAVLSELVRDYVDDPKDFAAELRDLLSW